MNWFSLIQLLLPIIIELIGGLEDRGECPDGVCPPVREDLEALKTELAQPSTQDAKSFFECFDFQRFFAAISEMVAVVRDANKGVCPPEEN